LQVEGVVIAVVESTIGPFPDLSKVSAEKREDVALEMTFSLVDYWWTLDEARKESC
jgi:hypothetical protein